MSIHRGSIFITASSTQTISFGNSIFEDIAFYVESGTGTGAIKVSCQGVGCNSYNNPNPNRIALASVPTPYKIVDLPMQKVVLISSATASTTHIVYNAWTRLGKN